MLKRQKWSLVGIPDDLGVVNVGGRIGAAGGPSAVRGALCRLKGPHDVKKSLKDFGDMDFSPSNSASAESIRARYRDAADLVRRAHSSTGLSVVVGGGHDHGYPHLMAIAEWSEKARMGCINIDAHLDVRKPDPFPTSGSPFYMAIEEGVLDPRNFIEFGTQEQSNGPELFAHVKNHKVKVVPFSELRNGKAAERFSQALKELASKCHIVVISLDLDSIAAAFCPGVSAPQAEGFTPMDIMEIMEVCGKNKRVVSLGVFEMNPLHDSDAKTAIVSATAIHRFISCALCR